MKKLLLALLLLCVPHALAAQVMDAAGNTLVTATQSTGAGAATNFWNFRLTDGTNFYNGLTDTQLRATPVPVSGSGNFAVTGTFWQVTQPVSLAASVTVTDGAGALNVIVDSGTTTVTQGTGTNLHTVVDSGAVTVSDGAGALNVIVDSGALTATVTDGAGALNVIVDSGAITNTPPSNQSVNLNQVVGTAADVNSGNKSAGTLRVVLATDQPALTNKLLVTPDSVALPANQSVNVAQLAATTTDTNSGNKSAGTLRVVLATDQPALTNKLLVTPDSVALPANQSVNLNQVAGVATAVGNGTAAGAVRVALPTDGTGVVGLIAGSATVGSIASITTSVTPGTAAANEGKAEDAAHNSADTGVAMWGVRTDPTTTAYTSATTEYSPVGVDYVGAVFEGAHPGRFSCFVPLTATVTTQCQAAPAAGLRAYVTSLSCSNGAATVQSVDVVFGTGAACVTATTALTHKYQMGTAALTTSPHTVSVFYGENSPLVPTAANAICVRPTAATAFGCTITGYVAP